MQIWPALNQFTHTYKLNLLTSSTVVLKSITLVPKWLFFSTPSEQFCSQLPLTMELIIRPGITCKKISCYMRDLACRWFIVKKLKYLCFVIKIFKYVKHC